MADRVTNDAAMQAAGAIPVRNAWYLLLYAWDMVAWRERSMFSAERSPSLLGLIARILADATEALLKYQLGRAHSSRSESIRGIRGRIGFAESLRRMSFERAAAWCTFPELSIDTSKNRIIKGTLHQLARDARVQSPNAGDVTELRERIWRVERMMDGVALRRITGSDFAQLQLGRNDRAYMLPLAACELVHRLEMPTEMSGDHALAALLRDEVTFHDLFERFVRNFYRIQLTRCRVWKESMSWYDELSCMYVPRMETDTTIEELDPPHHRIVIDTKYSLSTLATSRFGNETFKSANLYQMYAYLRTQEQLSPAHQDSEGILLYPTTTCDLESAMLVQGHKILVATVDLSKPWEEIETRLLSLVQPAERSA